MNPPSGPEQLFFHGRRRKPGPGAGGRRDLWAEAPLTVADREVLWTILPNRVLFRYVTDETLRATARRLIREKKVCRSLDYPPDRSVKRRWYFCKNQLSYYKKYKKYFGNKGLTG